MGGAGAVGGCGAGGRAWPPTAGRVGEGSEGEGGGVARPSPLPPPRCPQWGRGVVRGERGTAVPRGQGGAAPRPARSEGRVARYTLSVYRHGHDNDNDRHPRPLRCLRHPYPPGPGDRGFGSVEADHDCPGLRCLHPARIWLAYARRRDHLHPLR